MTKSIKHPFVIVDMEPVLAFAGKPFERDLGDRWVVLDSIIPEGVGFLRLKLHVNVASELTIGQRVAVTFDFKPDGQLHWTQEC